MEEQSKEIFLAFFFNSANTVFDMIALLLADFIIMEFSFDTMIPKEGGFSLAEDGSLFEEWKVKPLENRDRPEILSSSSETEGANAFVASISIELQGLEVVVVVSNSWW